MPVSWDMSVADAREDQRRVKRRLTRRSLDLSQVPYALAVGVAYSEKSKEAVAVCAPMLLSGAPVDRNGMFVAHEISDFPYVSGLFVYREGPAVCKLLESLPGLPPFAVFDSQGIAHPRGLGLAAHIGVLYDMPTIGMTRKKLYGYSRPLPEEDGAMADLVDKSKVSIGISIRYRARCEPIYCSPGHRTDLQTLKEYCRNVRSVRSCLPETLSLVHQRANSIARAMH